MASQSLQVINPDLFSSVRRHINSLKQVSPQTRKTSIMQLLKIVKSEQLPTNIFVEITHMCLKDVLKCFSDIGEACRQHSLNLVEELISRCPSLGSFLPYIFSILVERTNCIDLQGIANMPQKMRPPPGQKPKVLIKVIEPCEEIRLLYCNLISKIISLAEQDQIRKHLDDIVNIIRALIMDPSPEVQRIACNTLEQLCNAFRLLLLHYTEIMGRAVLLPLIAKKSKIRIAGLNALTAVLWCGLWKYNAFIMENLVGFRDPNSVPIKDFYEPSHNINYLATFINDENVKVRQEFLRHIKIWVCDLDDKYDHHGRLVPYLLSGLFDQDEVVKNTAMATIEEVGRQIEIQKQKQFRDSKQFAIDAAWTWDGQLVDLPLPSPLKKRPSLGSRFFIRGHVRKFWSALYKQMKDIKTQNRIRACQLALYGGIYTQNYLTQYLDIMIPHLLTIIIPLQTEDKPVCDVVEQMMFYIGRYCETSAYLHVMKSALQGQLVQNQQFLRAALKGMGKLVEGSLEAIPVGCGLSHKTKQISDLVALLNECNIAADVYKQNCQQAKQIVLIILSGLRQKANAQQLQSIMQTHCESLLKIFSASYYEQYYTSCQLGISTPAIFNYQQLQTTIAQIIQLHPTFNSEIESYLQESYLSPSNVSSPNWKVLIVIHNYLIESSPNSIVLDLCQQVIKQSMGTNCSIQILCFIIRYCDYLFIQLAKHNMNGLASVSILLKYAIQSLHKFTLIKKIPVYDQHLIKPDPNPSAPKINQTTFVTLYSYISSAIAIPYLNHVTLNIEIISCIIHGYLNLFSKYPKHPSILMQTIKTVWAISQRAGFVEGDPSKMVVQGNYENQSVFTELIDFIVERLETLGEPDHKKSSMLFSTFFNLLKCWPVIPNASTKLPLVYPNYPQLIQKLLRYAIDEKDIEMRDKYRELLNKLSMKMKPWFEFEARISDESRRFVRAKLLHDILSLN